jgi:Imelysin.
MNSSLLKKLLAPVFGVVLFSCSSDNSSGPVDPGNNRDYTAVINRFVDHTVLSTYASLKNEAIHLHALVQQLSAGPTQAILDSVCNRWVIARIPWEQSESFLFGPAEFRSLDPLLDSWPLDENQLSQVLASNVALDADYVRNGLGHVLRGFHAVEFLIFREGQHRIITTLTPREIEYLLAVTQVLRDDAITLWAMWNGAEGITGLELSVLEELEIDPGTGFANEFRNAGKAGSRYVSQQDAIGEIIEGCQGIADEVGNAKIAEPYNAKDPMLVESQFSYNSLTDFSNNVASIGNSLYGGPENNRDVASSIAGSISPALQIDLSAKITGAYNAINAIPGPFPKNLDKSVQIGAAIAALNALLATLDNVRLELVN